MIRKNSPSRIRSLFRTLISHKITPFISLLSIIALLFTIIFSITQPRQPLQQPMLTYHVDGKKILDSSGNTYIPAGLHLLGLDNPNWHNNVALDHLTLSQLQAAKTYWHANIVGLQVNSQALFAPHPSDSAYIALIDQEVKWTQQVGLNILLVMQYEETTAQLLPTQDTIKAWNLLSLRYKSFSHVFLDIFNEPISPSGHDDATMWNLWRNGGRYKLHTYVGMEQVVESIRNNGFQNLLFVEGLAAGEDIRLLPQYTLDAKNIVYAIHPYLSPLQHHAPSDWDSWFGTTTLFGNFPVVADEWSQYQGQYSYNSNAAACLMDAPDVTPQFLSYLHSLNIGVIGFALFPGTLIRGWSYTTPTAFDHSTASCPLVPFPNLSSDAQGVGQLLQSYFSAYN